MRNEKEIDFLESQIPTLAESAVKKAYLDSLSSGNSVLEVEGSKLYEITPDGTKKFVKDIENDILVEINKKIII